MATAMQNASEISGEAFLMVSAGALVVRVPACLDLLQVLPRHEGRLTLRARSRLGVSRWQCDRRQVVSY